MRFKARFKLRLPARLIIDTIIAFKCCWKINQSFLCCSQPIELFFKVRDSCFRIGNKNRWMLSLYWNYIPTNQYNIYHAKSININSHSFIKDLQITYLIILKTLWKPIILFSDISQFDNPYFISEINNK